MWAKLSGRGRVRRGEAAPEPPVRESDMNSYCVYCGHWHFGVAIEHCPRCKGLIFKWLPTSELRLLHSRSTLRNL